MSDLRTMVSSLAEAGRELLAASGWTAARSRQDVAGLLRQMMSQKAEVMGIALANQVLEAYRAMEAEERRRFFEVLRDDFSPDPDMVAAAIAAYEGAPGPETAQALCDATEAPRQRLIRTLNTASEATAALVDMRADLLDLSRSDDSLRVVDNDFQHLLASWFNRGFLMLRRIDWDSPAAILEQLIRYEAVHDIQGWDDLRRRLAEDRRCYGFFHPSLGDRILIFIEVALTEELSADVRALIESEPDPAIASRATTAIFYSINNCQKGLRGVSFGNFLIKHVVEELSRDLPGLTTYSTLSPIPGFEAWLTGLELDDDARRLAAVRAGLTEDRLLAVLAEHRDVLPDPDAARDLTALCAHYLLEAKDRKGRPMDRVARFHLGNGARLERINPGADPSPRGLRQSRALLVNYLYDLSGLERNHQAFHEEGRVLASRSVRALLA